MRKAPRGRPGVSCICQPNKRFLISENSINFETLASVDQENRFRIRQLRNVIHEGLWGDEVREIADCLEHQDAKVPYPTLANALYMRERRNWIIGSLYQLICEVRPHRISRVNLVRKSWAIYAGDLLDTDPRQLLAQLRKNILDAAGGHLSGWLFGVLEASFNRQAQCYQFHFHGTATDTYIDAINKLKDRGPWQPWGDEPGIPGCNTPIRVTRKPLDDVPYALGYQLKSFWKMRGDGRRIRLPNAEHVRSLVWLHRHRLEDIVLIMGLNVRDGRLAHHE